MADNIFQILNSVNVSEKTEQKNGLTYLSWSYAWALLKKRFPYSYYTVYESANGNNYFSDGKTCWVKTGVTLVLWDGKPDSVHNEVEAIEYLPIMDFKNKSVPLTAVTSMDVNKAIQRSLTKAVARHGVGLYVYSGLDLPEETEEMKSEKEKIVILISQIDAIVGPAMSTMSTNAEKDEYCKRLIIPIIGTRNYRTCKDVSKLENLLNVVQTRAQAS